MTAAVRVDLPLCGLTDLLRLHCGCPEHNDSFTMTAVEREYLAGGFGVEREPVKIRRMSPLLVERSAKWQGLTVVAENGKPKPIMINCHHAAGLCDNCCDDFAKVLADIPQLLDDLDVAIAGATRFVEHGIRQGTDTGESGGGHPAIAALQRLTASLKPFWVWFDQRDPARLADALRANLGLLKAYPEMPGLARDVSSAVSRARHVIDSPAEWWSYGPCPDCGRWIEQERIQPGDEKTPVKCLSSSCGYAAPLDVHQKRMLNAAEDRLLTVDELVGALGWDGDVVTRHQINGWIRRKRLVPRETSRLSWVNGEVVTRQVALYRVGDARELARHAAKKRDAS